MRRLLEAKYLRRLDGDASVLLVLTGIGKTSLSRARSGDDTGFGNQRVCQCRLAVVDVSDDRHVADVPLLVHHPTDLVYCEIHLHKAENSPSTLCTSQHRW